ncbi:MAG: LytR C-terminal domain-containing protein [Endomicrobium sp.]|jgi:hypothetical protein|nr:LytR C-terminal domain-containing protein [Endomicrobium sp.]
MFAKISKITFFALLFFFVISIASYIFYQTSSIFKNHDSLSCSILLYDIKDVFPDTLECYQVIYDKNTNYLKILSINTDIVLLKKYKKAKSLKALFREDLNKGLDSSIENFYLNLQEAIKSYKKSDFYIHMSFESFLSIMADNNLKAMVLKDDFLDKDLKLLNNLDFVERTLKFMPFKALNIIKKYNLIDTNISKISCLNLIVKLKIQKPLIMFCELPVNYVKARVEPDTQNIDEFLSNTYYDNNNFEHDNRNCFVDVRNASGKTRMAQKVTWLLRENKFDVLDWSNSNKVYEKTLIKSFNGNFKKCLDISKILNAGKILVSYNNKVYYNISIFVGQDCIVYDNFDKTGG